MVSTYNIVRKYNNKEKCIAYLKKLRWGKYNPICPFCNSNNTADLSKQSGRFHCNSCKTHFSVLTGTIFQDTRLELPKWFMLISLMVNSKQV